jgi:hypothetical protein
MSMNAAVNYQAHGLRYDSSAFALRCESSLFPHRQHLVKTLECFSDLVLKLNLGTPSNDKHTRTTTRVSGNGAPMSEVRFVV